MSKIITIPSNRNPYVVVINNHVYKYLAGQTVEVPDEVAEAIEDSLDLEPKPKPKKSRLGSLVDGSITEITAEDLAGVEYIRERAFCICQNLYRVTIPESVIDIDNNAFEACDNLVEVYNCSSLPIEAGSEDYEGVARNALNVYTPESGESKIRSIGYYLCYGDENERWILAYSGDETHPTLPEDINGKTYGIRNYAFANCDFIRSLTIPDSVTSIAYGSFVGCSSIESIVIGDGVGTIDSGAFQSSANITDITIGKNVTSIGVGAFCDFMGTAKEPNSVTYRIKATLPPSIMTGMYSIHAPQYIKEIIVPKGRKATYGTMTSWAEYMEKIVEEEA